MKAIYLFYIFKLAPRVIDNTTHKFWQNSVRLLNAERKKKGDKFYFWKIGKIYCREPHAIPMSDWTHSRFHPFCWKKYNAELSRAGSAPNETADGKASA